MAETSRPSAADLLAVRSRVSWGAIAAGAMVALTIYVVLTMLGVAMGIEMALRGSGAEFGAGAAIYSILVLLLAMFFGGWATSRLAVGESKLEAVLYGLILWGVLFVGMVWLLGSGMRTGFGALFGAASGAYSTEEGRIDFNRVARDLKQAGVDEATVNKYRGYYERVRDNPGAAADVGREMSGEAGARQVARQASWWSLAGLLVSLATVIIGSLVGSGELLQPVPILGVRRVPSDRRDRVT
jgi:ABC-type transport system involved in multi-copper enzyme maturation permease subunit